MHSCFSDMADKKRRKVNSFRNTNYGNQLSKVVKLIKKWVMDALKREKYGNVFLCTDIAQMTSESSQEGNLLT